MCSAKDFVVGSLICDLKQLLCEVGCSGGVDGSLGDGTMPNGDVAIYAWSEVSSGQRQPILADEDKKVEKVKKVEQQEVVDPIVHKGGCAKTLRVKMPAQEALQRERANVDADTPPKQSVSVDAGEHKERKGKTKVNRSKMTLRKQKSGRNEKPPRPGIMVSLGLVLAVVAFIIAAVVAVGVPLSSPRYCHANTKDKFNLYMCYTGYEEADEQYAGMGTSRLGTGVLLVDDDFADALQTDKHAGASRSISSPFHMIAALPYASVPLESEARAGGGDQCNRELQAKDERIKANEEMLLEKDNIIHMQEGALQAKSGLARVHHSSRVTRGQPTPARSAHRKFRRTSPLISSSARPLHVPVRIYVEGAVLWKAPPLVVSVDMSSGNNSLSCIPSSSFAASTSLASSCKTIRYALEHGQNAARKTSSPLELAVSAGVYLGECSEDGNTISIPTAIKKVGGSTGVVKIDCEEKGKVFSVTQDPTSTFCLEGLTITNGKSARGGAAFVEGGSLVLKDCTFDDLESLASAADGVFVGGGAIMFVGAVSLHADGCAFTNCRAASGSGGGILVSFQAVGGGWAMAAYALTILRSQFDGCGAGSRGGAVAAVADGGVERVDVLIDGITFDKNWIRSARSGLSLKGGHLYFSYLGDASNTNTTLRGCHFTNGLMYSNTTLLGGSALGGCYLEYSATATNVHQQIEACTFENTTLVGPEGFGGGVAVFMKGVSTNITFIFERCSFLHNVLQAGVFTANGGGVFIMFDGGDVRSVLLLVSRSSFERNLLTASGAGAGAEGGGLEMLIGNAATNITSTFDHCSFAHNVLRAVGEGGQALGGAIVLFVASTTAGGLLTSLLDSTFVGNRIAGGTDAISSSNGGAVHIEMLTTSAYIGPVRTLVHGCHLLANVVDGGGPSSLGGAICHYTVQPGASLHVVQSVIRGNSAGIQGGGFYFEQTEATPPTNLEMIVSYDPTYDPPSACDSASSADNGHGREYGYRSDFLVESSMIDSNIIISGDSTGSGGGVFALNANLTVRNSSVQRNKVDGTGGGIAVASTARLTLEGGAIIEDNNAIKAGTAIFSSSAGDITLGDGTKLGFHGRAGTSAIAIQSGSKFEHSTDAVLQCRPGERLLYNVSMTPATFSAWVINCDSVLAEDNGTRIEFAAPTCKQLQLGNSPLHTKQCINLPLHPAMLSASGTVSCSPCPNNQYSLEGGMMRGGKMYPIKCSLCPYGASCELGGAKIKTKANFWAETRTVTETAPTATPPAAPTTSARYNSASIALAHTTTLAMVTCPEGYCCANRSSGCVWDSDDACQGHRSRKYPLCGGCQQHFSQAIDGVGCVADAECRGKSFLRYILLQLFVVWTGSDVYSLFAARYPPLLAPLPSFLRPAACNSGAVAVVIYFFQMAMMAVPSGYNSLVDRATATLGELSMLRQLMLSSQGGTCAWKGMSMVHKLVWQLCLPFVLFLLLPIVAKLAPIILRVAAAFGRSIGCDKFALQVLRCCQNDRNRYVGRARMGVAGHAGMGSLQDAHGEPLIDPAAEVDEYEQQQDQQEEEQEQEPQEAPTLWGALACLALFSYTGFAEGTLQLVNCVDISGVRVMYYAGAVECKDWQWSLYLLLAILLLGPLYVVLLQLSAHCPLLSFVPHPSASAIQWTSLRALRQHATEPFKGGSWQWTAVLMLQRLLTVMCQSLSMEAIVSSLGVTVVSFFFTLLQLLVRPYRVSRVNDLQLLALVCLTLISVLNAAQSSFESAGVDADQDPALASLVRTADLFMFLLLLLPLLMLMYHTLDTTCADDSQEKDKELAIYEDDEVLEELAEQRRRHEEERAQLLGELELALAQKEQQVEAEKNQQLAEKEAKMEQQRQEMEQLLTQERQQHEQESQRHEQEKVQLIEQLAKQKSAQGARASAGPGTTCPVGR
jgi:hypothetical protein